MLMPAWNELTFSLLLINGWVQLSLSATSELDRQRALLIPSLNLHHDVRRGCSAMKTFSLDWHKLKQCQRHNWPEIWVSINYNMALQKEAVSKSTSFKLCNHSAPLVAIYELTPGWRALVHNHYRSDPFALSPSSSFSLVHPSPPSPPPPS